MAKDPGNDKNLPDDPQHGRPQGAQGPQGPQPWGEDGDFVSLEGPDVETPTAGPGGDASAADTSPTGATADDAADGTDERGDGLSPEDLSFLEDVSSGAATAPTRTVADEHLADLKRVTAEYANYRRRTEANRQLERDRAVGDVVKLLLPVLDDLDRAEKHGDLAEGGPLTTIAAKLRANVERIGLVGFGETGDAFDPGQHEAIFQKQNAEVTAATVADVLERGYRIGDVTLRVAKVVVDTPAD